jgi:hypothetical protein
MPPWRWKNGGLVLRWSRMAISLAHYHYATRSMTSDADDADERPYPNSVTTAA